MSKTEREWVNILETVGFYSGAVEALQEHATRKGKLVWFVQKPDCRHWDEVAEYLASKGFVVKYEM